MLSEVYLPILATMVNKPSEDTDAVEGGVLQEDSEDHGANEFLSNTHKFASQLTNAILQVGLPIAVPSRK